MTNKENWKEELNKLLVLDKSPDGTVLPKIYNEKELEDFIEKEVIEKLIEDIPDFIPEQEEDLRPRKEVLKTKWLNK